MRIPRLISRLSLVLLLAGCGDSTGPKPPAEIRVLSGDAQQAVAGSVLPQPLIVRVLDADGSPVSGAAVTWAITAGAGTLSASSSKTDAAGEARVKWTLGTGLGLNSTSAKVGALPSATFTAQATAGAPAKLEVFGGDGQTGVAGAVLEQPLEVRVLDAGGNPVSGTTVGWEVLEGEGTLSASMAATDSAGVARTTWTTGAHIGANRVGAWISGLEEVSFSASGIAGPPAKFRTLYVNDTFLDAGKPDYQTPSAWVRDANDNPVAGVAVQWKVTGGGAIVDSATTVTNSAGFVSAAWTMGHSGRNTLQLSVDGVPPLSFTATAVTVIPAGTLTRDTTWTRENSPYRVAGPSQTVTIPAGVALTIEPGVHIQNSFLSVIGTIRAVGTPDARIGLDYVYINVNEQGDSATADIDIEYADFESGGAASGPFTHRLILRNSVLKDAGAIMLWLPGADCYIERNIFVHSGGIQTETGGDRKVYIRNNSFYEPIEGIGGTGTWAINNMATWDSSATVIEKNSFWSTGSPYVSLGPDPHANLSAVNNYWGTTDEAVIQQMIVDQKDDPELSGSIDYEPLLSASDPDTPTLPAAERAASRGATRRH